MLGPALEPTVAALQAVIRTDKNVIAVGFAMDALARLVNLPSQEGESLPLIADLRAILGESPLQCWESLVRADVLP